MCFSRSFETKRVDRVNVLVSNNHNILQNRPNKPPNAINESNANGIPKNA